MRKQIINTGRIQRSERIVHRDGIIRHVHGAQQSDIVVPEFGSPQKVDPAQHPVVTAAAPAVQPVTVIGDLVSVEGDADLQIEFVEDLQMLSS